MSQTSTQERRSALDDFAAGASRPASQDQLPVAIEPHTLAILSRSELDAQMASAGTRPRDLAAFRGQVKAIACMSEEAAAECHYALPARRDDGDPIEGPSVRFAEILAYAWGNNRVGARVIDEAMDHVTAQGIFSDVEKNSTSTFEVRRRITDRRGRRYSLDMINVTANAACAIARRNAILQAIPRPLWLDLYQEARAMAAGGEGELVRRRDMAIAAFLELGLDEARIFTMLGVKDRDDIGRDELIRLRGIYTAVKDGTMSIRDVSAPADRQERTVSAKSALDAFAAGSKTVVEDEPSGNANDGSSGSPTLSSAAAAPDRRTEMIDKIMAMAADKELSVEERLENLELQQSIWKEELADRPNVVTALFDQAVQVAHDKVTAAKAKKYVEQVKG